MSSQPNDLATLLTSVKESLEGEIHSIGEALFVRFDTQAAWLERQGTALVERIEKLERNKAD